MQQQEQLPIKLAIIGNNKVGKTSLIKRIQDDKFDSKLVAGEAIDFRTIKNYKIEDQNYDINLYDVAGNSINYDSFPFNYIKNATAIAIAFNLQNFEYYNQSEQKNDVMEQIHYWLNIINENAINWVPVFFVGCQFDRITDKRVLKTIDLNISNKIKEIQQSNFRIQFITQEKIKGAQTQNYFVTSSLNGHGVTSFFNHFTKAGLLNINQLNPGSKLKVKILIKEKNTQQCC